MRELDLVCLAYLDDYYEAASTTEKAVFHRLLDQADADIHAWIMDYAEPDDADLRDLIALMRGLRATDAATR
jgi:succinate dehydrogenase flavin-adding protein (antitoxin of CptAB toxin-antitoxin module)